MKHVPCLLLLAAALVGCTVENKPGVVTPAASGAWTTIGGGVAPIHDHNAPIYYHVDAATQTCWVRVSDALASLDCCDLRRVPEASPVITWETDASCTPPVAPPPGA